MDIVNLKRLASAVAHGASVIDGVLADGKVNYADLPRIPSLLVVIREFAAVGFVHVIPEAKDLDAKEAAALAAHFKAEFNLADDATEVVVEQGLDILTQLATAFGDIKGLVDSIRRPKAA